MTNTYIFESDLTGMYEVTLNTNNVLSGPFNLNFTYGNLYTFLHNYNIDVVDENDAVLVLVAVIVAVVVTVKVGVRVADGEAEPVTLDVEVTDGVVDVVLVTDGDGEVVPV